MISLTAQHKGEADFETATPYSSTRRCNTRTRWSLIGWC